MYFSRVCLRRLIAAIMPLLSVAPSHAAISLGGTRVIYAEKAREASVLISNQGDSALLVQSWIDGGEGKPQSTFLVTPPLGRLDAGKESLLRILRADEEGLPKDRETVYWLNVKEIPQKSEAENVLQVAVRTRIKLFYRPAGVAGNPAEAPAQLGFCHFRTASGASSLRVSNPTAFNVTFYRLALGKEDGDEIRADMVSPFDKLELDLPARSVMAALKVHYATINDFGGITPELVRDAPSCATP